MQLENTSWARFLARALVLVVGVFGAVRLAVAGPGVAGGAPRTFVTVSGTITGMSGTQRATFHFRRAGMTADLCAPEVNVAIADNGAFSVPVPLDDATPPCPATTFNGSDVVVDVDLPGAPRVVRDANVNPVPYAIYAGTAAGATGGLDARLAALERRAQVLEATVNVTNRARGVGRMSDEDVRLPLSTLVVAGSRALRAVIVTVSATAPNVIHTGSWLVVTGSQSGAFVSRLAMSSYSMTGVLDLVASSSHQSFTTDDALSGVTIRFRGMPTSSPWDWSYSVVPVSLPP